MKQTTTVITTVGPFLKYGETLVAACADAGTHYVDITGEVSFMKWTYKKYVESCLFFFCSSIVPYHFPPHPLVLSMPRRAVRGPCTPLSTLTCDPRDPCSFRYDAAAKKSGARIVHACGYDSIPSDLGALMGKCCHRCCHQCMLSQIIFEYITCIYILIVCHANTLLTIQ